MSKGVNKLRFIKPDDIQGDEAEVRDIAEGSNYLPPKVIAFHKPNPDTSVEYTRQNLPIFKWRTNFLFTLEKSRVVIVIGETGSGKSTQLPQYIYEAGWLENGMGMIVTQPRRVAAVTLAKKVAEEKNSVLGETIGYSVRFEDCRTIGKTAVVFMTEGLLIRELLRDPLLRNYRVVMLDEVHERTVNTDLLLGLLKLVLRKRPNDLRLVISSATVDADKLLKFFSNMKMKSEEMTIINDDKALLKPIHDVIAMSVEGRQHQVDIYYSQDPMPDYLEGTYEAVLSINSTLPPGDILVFLTGQEEIIQVVNKLLEYTMTNRDKRIPKLEVLALYSNMPYREQMKVFNHVEQSITIGNKLQPRRVIVSTNISETSVTVPGISYVIDCGFTKTVSLSKKLSIPNLLLVPISQAAADQRAGRAGRIKPGKVFRLYSEESWSKLPKFAPPEMVRSDLSHTILEMKSLGIDKIVRFPFLSPPPVSNIMRSLELLYALNAIDDDANLTLPKGNIMVELPLHPMASAMLIASSTEENCSAEVAAIAALMQVNNIFINNPNQRRSFEKAQRQFGAVEGDHITQLNALRSFEKQTQYLDKTSLSSWCGRQFINKSAAYKALAIRDCLKGILQRNKLPWVSAGLNVRPILRSIVKGFYMQVARLSDSGSCYKTVRGDHPLDVHPNSIVHRLQWEVITQSKASCKPEWVIFTNLVATADGRDCMDSLTIIPSEEGVNMLLELAPHFYRQGTIRELMDS